MRRSLIWALGATGALTVAALWTAQAPQFVSAIEPRLREHQLANDAAPSLAPHAPALPAPLPERLPSLAIEPAKRDVFVPYQPPAPPPAVVPAPPPPPVAPPPPPQAPMPSARFLGNMLTPEGTRLVYLMQGDTAIAAVPGQQLADGYVVESVTAEAVNLLYPSLDADEGRRL